MRLSMLFTLLIPTLLMACDGSFDGVQAGQIVEPEVEEESEIEFRGGGQQQENSIGAIVEIDVKLPESSYAGLFDETAGSVDPTRMLWTASVVLGDPADGGFEAGDNLTPFFIDEGMLAATSSEGSILVELNIDTLFPITFPSGSIILSVELIDDEGETETSALTLDMLATDRPNVVIEFLRPSQDPTPDELPLPTEDDGFPVLGGTRPFTLILRITPNPETGEAIDLEAIRIAADRDLGDPGQGGIAAFEDFGVLIGTNLETTVDPKTGEVITGFRFQDGSGLLPDVGAITFTSSVSDVLGDRSFEESRALIVLTPILLEPHVLDIFVPECATIGCHDAITNAQGLNLEDRDAVVETAIQVVANQPDEGSCAPLRIEPFEPLASYLYHKCTDTHDEGCVLGRGRRMPRTGPGLTEEELEVLRQWILQGAYDQ